MGSPNAHAPRAHAPSSRRPPPPQWKDGARNTLGGRDGGRAIGENKALAAAKRFSPYAAKCGVCKQSLHQAGLFCQTCAYAKGAPRRSSRSGTNGAAAAAR